MATKSFDEQLRCKVLTEFRNNNTGREMASAYEQTQARLRRDFYARIAPAEPDLTDHGYTHVSVVKDNVLSLLSDDGCLRSLSGVEIYCLGMSILFHDAGNIYGREDHQRHIANIFDEYRGVNAVARREKTLVLRAVRAHTGLGQDGSADTLKYIAKVEQLSRRPVRLRELAAILRLADELAEGPDRTSEFAQATGQISEDSEVYHKYAESCHVLIDRRDRRISIDYEVEIAANGASEEVSENLSKLLHHIYKRIIKVDQERQYGRHYSDLLAPFRSTDVSFNFHCRGDLLEPRLAPIRLAGLVVPGQNAISIPEIDPIYEVDTLVQELVSRCLTQGEVS
jgi:hypothetical protein